MAKLSVQYVNKLIPDAYHGTEFSVAKKIKAGTKFEPSTDRDSYLGDGVYFFETDMGLAVWWAKKRTRRPGTWAVLQATIQLGRCLDLFSQENRDKLKFWRTVLAERLKDTRIEDPWVINSFAEEHGLDTVRCIFKPEAVQPIYEGSKICESFRVVISVRNIGNISPPSISMACTGTI